MMWWMYHTIADRAHIWWIYHCWYEYTIADIWALNIQWWIYHCVRILIWIYHCNEYTTELIYPLHHSHIRILMQCIYHCRYMSSVVYSLQWYIHCISMLIWEWCNRCMRWIYVYPSLHHSLYMDSSRTVYGLYPRSTLAAHTHRTQTQDIRIYVYGYMYMDICIWIYVYGYMYMDICISITSLFIASFCSQTSMDICG